MKYEFKDNTLTIEFGETKTNEVLKEHLTKFLESCLHLQIVLHRDFTEDDEILEKTRQAAQNVNAQTAQPQAQPDPKPEENIVPKSVNYSDVLPDEAPDVLPPFNPGTTTNMAEWVEPETPMDNSNIEIEDEFGDDI
jgi:hypothetical protein